MLTLRLTQLGLPGSVLLKKDVTIVGRALNKHNIDAKDASVGVALPISCHLCLCALVVIWPSDEVYTFCWW